MKDVKELEEQAKNVQITLKHKIMQILLTANTTLQKKKLKKPEAL